MGKPYRTDPELPDSERLTREELEELRRFSKVMLEASTMMRRAKTIGDTRRLEAFFEAERNRKAGE